MYIADFIQQNEHLKINSYDFPKKSFVYLICELNGEIIYIGSTMNLQTRFKIHYTKVEFYNKPIFFFSTPIDRCIEIERKLIEDIKPRFNLQWIVKKPGRPKGIWGGKSRKKECTNIRKQIIKIMDEKNISQSEIAKRMKVSRQRVNEIIYTKACFQPATIKKLEKALEIKFIIQK